MSASKASPAKAASEPGRGPAQGLRTRHPGDLSPEEMVARVLRVDHAGEYGARRIYEGQKAVLGARAQFSSRNWPDLNMNAFHLALWIPPLV